MPVKSLKTRTPATGRAEGTTATRSRNAPDRRQSESVDYYLKAIYTLSGAELRRVGSSELAQRLGVAPASITNMLQKLAAAQRPAFAAQQVAHLDAVAVAVGPRPDDVVLVKLQLSRALLAIHARNLPPDAARAELIKAVPQLIAANKCPDFIEDKGHYFGDTLPDDDKLALIEFLKTM